MAWPKSKSNQIVSKGCEKWGIQKKENNVSENKFPTDFKINEGTCLNINCSKTLVTDLVQTKDTNYSSIKDNIDLLFKPTKASHELLESLVECGKQSSGKGKGPSLKLGNQPVPVKVTLARIRALTALYAIADDISFTSNIDSITLPSKIRSVNNWTCKWTDKEDKQFLKSKFDMMKYEHSYAKSLRNDCYEVFISFRIQVKSYLHSERFRLKFCQESATLRRFWPYCFSRQNFKENPWLVMLFHIILDQSPTRPTIGQCKSSLVLFLASIIVNYIRSQGFHLKFCRKATQPKPT